MKTKLRESLTSVQQTLNIIWMLLTVLFLLLALYYQWEHFQAETERKMESIAQQTRTKVDDLIEDVLSAVYSLPISIEKLQNCRQELLPLLRNTMFSNPTISGLVISDQNNQPLCSTLEGNITLPSPFTKGPILFGPIKIGNLNEKIFLLQQKFGHNYVGIYLLEQMLGRALNYVSPEIEASLLYDKKSAKIVLQQGRKSLFDLGDSSLMLAEAQLQNLDDFKVILIANPKYFQNAFISHLVLASLIILSLSIFLYMQIRQVVNQRFSLVHALKTALKKNCFQPVYQPIMDISHNRFCAAEILTRWLTDVEEITPESFIDEAEQSGLIVPITLQILQKAFEETKNLLKTHPYFHLSVNVSACHFQDENFFSQFYKLCGNYEIKPHQIMLELTERQLLDQDNEELIAKMHEIRQKGYSLAIDDFGTGHASIKYLQHFPFNYLKIDKIFIHAIGTGAITENLNVPIIHMANSLKLEIIAEGVETKEQLNFLQKHQVKFMQGWYFERAVPYEHLHQIMNGVKHE